MDETNTELGNNVVQNKGDNDVSVIAVIEKENDRLSTQVVDPSNNEKQSRRVFELSDERSKMALRRQLELEALTRNNETEADYKDVDILRKLPPGTIVVKQDKKYKDDSDYVRDSTEISSGGSTSGGGASKTRTVHRAVRKSRGTGEIRRNPIRVSKKDPDKDFPRPRQRLLSAKRKEMFFDLEPSKRGKSSTMPYMNTRSVTRKMYNVGATYQAPTMRDATEWKEWPVHGMHERPVFHHQVGLAAEYLGRYFTSLDGISYSEIVDRPEIEVVSVDPRSDILPSFTEKKQTKKTKPSHGSFSSKNVKASCSTATEKSKSFERCMHESFHCVLGYCSQVMTPLYKCNVDGKTGRLNENKNSVFVTKEQKFGMEKLVSMTNIAEQSPKNDTSTSKDNLQKPREGNKILENCTIAMTPQNIKNFSQTVKTRLFPAQKVYLANSQKSRTFTNLKTLPGAQVNIQDVVRSSKNPLILVNPSDSKDTQILKPVSGNMNVIKLEENNVSNESLTDVSSLYKNLVSNEDAKQTPTQRGKQVEFTVTKYLLDNSQQNKVQVTKELNAGEKKLYYEMANKETNVNTVSSHLNKSWCSNDASEIAKILSEYNKSALKKPAIENQSLYSSVRNIKVHTSNNREENVKQNTQENSMDRNVNIKFPQGRWRRFHLTVEKLKDLKGGNENKLSAGVVNKQLFKIDQTTADPSTDRKTDVSMYLESIQRSQINPTNIEKKENLSTNRNVIYKAHSIQELLENTAMLYCAATGTHQDDLATYIDSLDAVQSVQWLEACKNLIM